MEYFSPLEAVSPMDGRYRRAIAPLSAYFSEAALIRYRVRVEIEYLLALADLGLPQIPPFTSGQQATLRGIFSGFGLEDAQRVKAIEAEINHDVKAVYQYYLGWFDGNPAHLYSLPPEGAGAKYIEYMGGPAVAIEKAKTDYANGEYRWVAQVMSDVVFGFCKDNLPPYIDPGFTTCYYATQLEADALEQLGYQAESGPWRNFFLGGAKELRDGVNTNVATPATGSPDILHSMTSDLLFDYLAIRLNGPEAAKHEYTFNMIFPDINEQYLLSVENGVLTYTEDKLSVTPNTTIIINRSDLDDVILGEKEISDVDFSSGGNIQDFKDFLALLDDFEFWFNVVLP